MSEDIKVRAAQAGDIAAMQAFLFEHGANQWNFLPEPEVAAHLGAIADGRTQAVLAEQGGQLLGFVTFLGARSMVRYQSREHLGYPHGYVCEAVVHREHSGKGLGSRLLDAAVEQLRARGFREVYIERHEENLASAGMMRKAGFVEVESFADPARRFSGSRRTTVCRIVFDSASPRA
ncbi:MAG TPA: GNAT family N-acetyltransferase [Noviherbaspirillum sp.]|uniref:GNAT family N-acetyltransferase n=1 Tax=Noviherbaspirillum sp. TaxID=1926288 RepID=UPI002D4E76EA|nr:GNAT family N-acetyltransferase [Noviherbaspirillum sp.]HYD93730.1 GNAT family N-acetyltransferase [Noviherbaspirillum sp.]